MKQTISFEIEDNLLHSLEKIVAQWNMSVAQYFQSLDLSQSYRYQNSVPGDEKNTNPIPPLPVTLHNFQLKLF